MKLDRLSKNPDISNFMKIRPVGADLFHADGRTDGQTNTTKLIAAFHNFANAPNKGFVNIGDFPVCSSSSEISLDLSAAFGNTPVVSSVNYT